MSVPEDEKSKIIEVKMEDTKLELSEEILSKPHGFIEKDGIQHPFFHKKPLKREWFETKHDIPCPPGMGEAVSTHHGINEWVLNHLPLKEDEKKALIHDLSKDVTIKKREETVKKRKLKKKRKIPKKVNPDSGRLAVKDS